MTGTGSTVRPSRSPISGGSSTGSRGLTVEQIRALPSMHPNRADVITGGTLVLARVAARLHVPDLIISESDILDGIALALLR